MDWIFALIYFPPDAWLRAALCFVLCARLLPLLIPAARRLQLVDHPGGRKQHDGAIPVIGGLVICAVATLSFGLFENFPNVRVAVFSFCMLMLVVVGQLDDRIDLAWPWRIGAQTLAALLVYFVAGVQATNLQDVFGFAGADIGLLALPFTIFVVVGVINALNMADGIDGLAGTLALVSLALFTGFALYAGNHATATRLLALGACVAGFLLWNFRFPWQPRARVFLGNGGSMLLGFAIAFVAVRLSQDPAHPVSPVLGPWTLALPLIDCVVLILRRIRQGRSPFSADRQHMHHLLLDAGFGVVATVVLLGTVSLLLGLGAAIALKLGAYRPLLVLLFFVLIAGWFLFTRDHALAVARLSRLHPSSWRRDVTA